MHLHYKYPKEKEEKIFNSEKYYSVYLGMGCFWEKEPLFWNLKNVIWTEVGYSGNNIEAPSCSDAFLEGIDYQEVVGIVYKNPSDIFDILEVFWNKHTIDVREDFPVPPLYKSVIYYSEYSQLALIKESLESLERKRASEGNNNLISTIINPVLEYVKADEHHQQYLLKRNGV